MPKEGNEPTAWIDWEGEIFRFGEIIGDPELLTALSKVSEQSMSLTHFFGARYPDLTEAEAALITASVLASLPALLSENPHLYKGMDEAAKFYKAQRRT